MGVFLKKNVVEVAGKALKENITALGPRVLPVGELIKCARDKSYVPDFKKVGEGGRKDEGLARAARRARAAPHRPHPSCLPSVQAFEHFLLHTGGRGVRQHERMRICRVGMERAGQNDIPRLVSQLHQLGRRR